MKWIIFHASAEIIFNAYLWQLFMVTVVAMYIFLYIKVKLNWRKILVIYREDAW